MSLNRTFTMADQLRFGRWSGDTNPIHVDPIAARRTIAGQVIVHGVHVLLWLLDEVAQEFSPRPQVKRIQARFDGMTFLDRRLTAHIQSLGATATKIAAYSDGNCVCSATLYADPHRAITGNVADDQPAPKPNERRSTPSILRPDEIGKQRGEIAIIAADADGEALFPNASAWLGSNVVSELAGLSYLVGMVVPGLHSLFGGLDITLSGKPDCDGVLKYHVADFDPRFQLLRLAIQGPIISGQLKTFIRPEPTRQPDIVEVAELVAPGAFAGSRALVIGGSRGLGELTAKIIAAGGGDVTITYAAGGEDARAVASEIRRWGGRCLPIKYDVRMDAKAQLKQCATMPSQIYYFASPRIALGRGQNCSTDRFYEFCAFYIQGFKNIVDAARIGNGEIISIFYPSSIFVESGDASTTAYAMAKGAGEILCREIERYVSDVHVVCRRLPRLATDQTATMRAADYADPLATMVPIVMEMHDKAQTHAKLAGAAGPSGSELRIN